MWGRGSAKRIAAKLDLLRPRPKKSLKASSPNPFLPPSHSHRDRLNAQGLTNKVQSLLFLPVCMKGLGLDLFEDWGFGFRVQGLWLRI